MNVLTLFPDMDQQFLNRIFNKLFVGRKIAGVVKQRAVLLVSELAKRQAVTGLRLLPEI
jgi:hypothetical protein